MKYLIVLFAFVALAMAEGDEIQVEISNENSTDFNEIENEMAEAMSKVVGGSEVTPHSVPYQVALQLVGYSNQVSFCGGSLIDTKTVLTAAHCVQNTKQVRVTLGTHNVKRREPGSISMMSNRFTVHDGWNPQSLSNDIALIHLPQPVQLSSYISTIPVSTDMSSHEGQMSYLTGWGRYSDRIQGISDVLRSTQTPIVSNNLCNYYFGGSITRSQICTSGSQGKGSCNGDSGGPLVIGGRQVGLVSFGIQYGCEVGFPAVYTRVAHYANWINAHKY